MKHLLICDNCGEDGHDWISIVGIGEPDELKDEIRTQFVDHINEYAIVYADAIVDWDEASLEPDRAGMWVNDDQTNRHINWWTVPLDEHRHAIVRIHVLDGGGIEVTQVGGCDGLLDAVHALKREYEREREHPSFYAGWDDEYCWIRDGRAELTVETMDSQVNLVLIDTDERDININFEYLG